MNAASRAIIYLLVLAACGCASPREPGSWTSEELVIYQNDFSRDDGMFAVHRPLWEVEDGLLHLQGKDPGGHLLVPYGRDSVTTFSLRLSPEKPQAHINVLWNWNEGRETGHCFIVRHDSIHQFTRINGKEVYRRFTSCDVSTGRWHEVAVYLKRRSCLLCVDGRSVVRTFLSSDLPEMGHFFILALDSEFWLDDLKIVAVKQMEPTAYEAARPSPVAMHSPHALTDQWRMETVVPPAPIVSAPFDIAVLPDGRVVVEGPLHDSMVSIDVDGTVSETGIRCGGNYFDVSADGRLWFYRFPGGLISVTTSVKPGLRVLAKVDPTHCPGSISVARDGSILYLIRADDARSYLYRYADGALELLAEARHVDSFQHVYASVEVTDLGHVWITGVRGIYLLEGDEPVVFMGLSDFYPLSTTSDKEGNLYIAGYLGPKRGIFQVTLSGELRQVADLSGILSGPAQLGIYWDDQRGILFAVHKEGHQVYLIRNGSPRPLLDGNFLSTPIALAIRGDGEVFVNGDELGVQHVDAKRQVHVFCTGLVCWQPPASDMVFFDDTLYYSGSAPAFESFIYAIDKQGTIVLKSPVDGMPAGIDTMSDGRLVYADYELGEIRVFRPFASDEVIVRNLTYPVGLVVGPDDRIFLSTSDADDAVTEPGTVIEAPRRRILAVKPGGKVKELYRFDTGSVTFFDVDSGGVLYIPLEDRLYALHPDGRLQTLAEGFSEARDAKLAPDGSIYVADTDRSALYRLVR